LNHSVYNVFKYSYITQFADTLCMFRISETGLTVCQNLCQTKNFIPTSTIVKYLYLYSSSNVVGVSIIAAEIQNRDKCFFFFTFRRKNNNRKMHIIANIMLLEQWEYIFCLNFFPEFIDESPKQQNIYLYAFTVYRKY